MNWLECPKTRHTRSTTRLLPMKHTRILKTCLERIKPPSLELQCSSRVPCVWSSLTLSATVMWHLSQALTELLGVSGKIIDSIVKNGFQITDLQLFHLERVDAAEFLEVYKGVLPEYHVMILSLHLVVYSNLCSQSLNNSALVRWLPCNSLSLASIDHPNLLQRSCQRKGFNCCWFPWLYRTFGSWTRQSCKTAIHPRCLWRKYRQKCCPLYRLDRRRRSRGTFSLPILSI